MSSGIYKLTFPSGQFYIGKTVDFDRRWKEHQTKMEKGTAAKAVQECFNTYGYPTAEILYEVHPDHIDVIEPLIISQLWDSNILNTVRERTYSSMREEYWELVKESLETLCGKIVTQDRKISSLQRKISDIKKGTYAEQLELQVYTMTEISLAKDREINKLKNRGFFERLFNL